MLPWWRFFPKSAVFAIVLGISVCVWGIFTLALDFLGCACWSSLWQRVFGSSWISPLFFPDRRFGYKATCIALAPVCRLSFVLGPISFWMGFALCLRILFAPCGCQRAYCGPHCGRESARVIASLLGSSPSGVQHLSRVCSSV